jgi:protein-L-isoaspartate(D-aspartate) O-methyltransferase
MNDERDPALQARHAMVEKQLRGRGIANERILRVMAELPREAFVPDRASQAYEDGAVPIAAGQTISQPYVVARMTELLRPEAGDLVLEVGTGSGYQAAVLAALGCRVITYERQPELADTARRRLERLGLGDRVDVRLADGSAGDPDGGPFDGIIVTAAAPRMPDTLRGQLALDARLVIPVGPRDHQELVVVERTADGWREWSDGAVVFVPLVGAAGYPA